jgi:hypothetical protein
MKSLIQAVAMAAALVAPVVSFAQSNTPITRAQVRAELEQLEKAGYRPGDGDSINYPEEIQAAEARVAAKNEASGYGGAVNGASSGRPGGSKSDWDAMYGKP